MSKIPLSLACILMLVAPAAAQDAPKKAPKGPAETTDKTCGGRIKLENIWRELVARHDKDRDGKITVEEFTRGEAQFANHDRNGDGVISSDDFPSGRYWNGFGPGFARRADRNKDKKVEKSEWDAMASGMDRDGDGIVSDAEFVKMAGKRFAGKQELVALSLDQDGDGVIETTDLASLFDDLDRNRDGELDEKEMQRNRTLLVRSKSPLPKVGQLARDFELPLQGAKQGAKDSVFHLASFRGKRPVALVFGSYT